MAQMRKVRATWRSLENNDTVEIEATLEVSAISDLIEFFEEADGKMDYVKGDIAARWVE